MKNRKYIALLFLLSLKAWGQDIEKEQIYLADPTIFKDNGIYYLYGTKNDPRIEGEGFLVYTSTDLKHWQGPVGAKNGFALKKGDAFGTEGFWAPQIFKYHSKYYMAYTANEHIAIATGDSPLGPFTNNMKALKAPVKQIDPFVFFDDGKIYLYHVRLQDGNRIFVAEMTKDLQGIKPETLRECINAREGWENTKDAEWPVSEGPTVLKKDGLYYLFYSANDFRNPDYAVGYAVSKNPLGPWKKSKYNPVISTKNTGKAGTGHGDLIKDDKGSLYYVLHTHYSNREVHPRKTALIKFDFQDHRFKASKDSFQWIGL
ncbi:glycoside hydrolase family 43 protein [Sinomicrobium weinanense]|uniref:Family 43 glycosylhydrolase n=1 Tax=Sinomicrobium weinanense TaxID=2842200 RepID=A0A926JTU3_9FLAO|nr:glycoside hydrolase family 43 protein [Sinomicrobium weinanense]MBC9797133.1 family 43 glycosylhydrolase [Sinomicrobium weinanense]MBU3124834.1 glycoside hydrolase family 43 protein [Sinomicrobium weinanense]